MGGMRFTLVLAAAVASANLPAIDGYSLVDAKIGTAMDGNTCPGPVWPFGMVQPGPDTIDREGGDYQSRCNGYDADNKWLMGFTQTHLSGTGCVDLQDFLLLPFTGSDPKGVERPLQRMEKASEVAQPGYYAISLEGGSVRAELTATRRCAYHRYTLGRGGTLKVLVDTQAGGYAWWRPERPPHRVTLSESTFGSDGVFEAHNRVCCWNDDRDIFIKMRFDPAPAVIRELSPNGRPGKRYVAEFMLGPRQSVVVKAAISGVDLDGARANFAEDPEAVDFDARRAECVKAWRGILGSVTARGDEGRCRCFYTAIYRTMYQPNLLSDADGRVRFADMAWPSGSRSGKVTTVKGHDVYTNFSTWDTFRAAHPLYTILKPGTVDGFVKSMMDHFAVTGKLPIWQMFGGENYCMPGVHSIPIIADAMLKGITDVDPKTVLKAMDASQGQRYARSPDYDRQGYLDFETSGASVSCTLERGIDDWSVAKVAELAGDKTLAERYHKRAGFYRNLFDPTTGMMRARDKKGTWRTPFDPYQQRPTEEQKRQGIRNDYTEGGAMQYAWHVLQDPEGLVRLHGGPEKFAAALENLFTDRTVLSADRAADECSGRIGQFALGNEHDQHVPYLWQYAGRPDRAAEVIRELCDRYYSPTPAGICGNDDCGQMSAWYVFACLGFYPVNPVGGDYVLGAPQLEEVSIALENGKVFRMVAKGLSATNKYVKSVTLNGEPLKGFILKHADIMSGGELVFEMCAKPELVPLAEHPRPDWERAEWMNLNGKWDFGFEKGKYDRKILVPFGWGSPLSGVKDEGDTGYYRRCVTVPVAWKGKRIFVVVGAADHDTNCIFGGEDLGKHVGGYTPFEYELTKFVRWGEEQALEFTVWDPPPEKAWSGHYLYGKQGYGNARGIWQTVYLEARGGEFVESARFIPSIARKSVTADVVLGSPASAGLCCRIELDGAVHELRFAAGEVRKILEIPVPKPHFWTLDDPHLYDVRMSLIPDPSSLIPADEVRAYFGFREIGVGKNPNGDNYVTLNGTPIYLQMCLDQSYHPGGWYTFPSDEFMKNEILLSKRLALSGNRVHVKVEVPRKLYWADRLGLLIQADVPCAWGDASEAMFEEHGKCFEGMVKRDFNHPCVYQWTLFNETWGLFSNRSLTMGLASGEGGEGRIYRDTTQRKVAEVYRKAKTLDPTRLVEDNSPCNEDHVVTDVNTWHGYRSGRLWEKTVKEWCERTFVGSTNNFIGGRKQNGAPMMNSECGNVWGYEGSTGDCDFSWDYHLMINAFRRHLKCGGWLYTEHHDICNEWNGYVRYDRSPKYDGLDELAGMTLADLHRDAAIFFAGTPGRETGEFLAPGRKVTIPVGVSLMTDKYAGKKLTLDVEDWFFDGRGEKSSTRTRCEPSAAVPARSWQCETPWGVVFTAPEGPSCGCVVVKLSADGKEIARNFWSFGVTNAAHAAVVASKAEWDGGTTNVLGGLKLNGFGKGFFEFELDAPAQGGVFRAELSAKRKNGKDFAANEKRGGLDYMLGGGNYGRSKNPNSYPQTSDEKFPSNLKVFIGGKLVQEMTLPDDPADHRGILSWLSQPCDGHLHEAGSYGWLVEAPVSAGTVRDGKVTVRLEADRGLAVYGAKFGRYPMGPHVEDRGNE